MGEVLQVKWTVLSLSHTSLPPASHRKNNTKCSMSMKECDECENAPNQTAGKCATYFEAYFVMLPLPPINLPSVGACGSHSWNLHFSMHPSFITQRPPGPSSILSASQRRDREIFILPKSQISLCIFMEESVRAGMLRSLLEINSPVIQRTVYLSKLRHI